MLEKDYTKTAENILAVFKESEVFNICAAAMLLMNPNDSKVHPIRLSNKRLKVANDIFTRVLNNDHTDSVAIQGSSLLFLHSRQWEDAVAFSTQCLELDLSSRDMGLAFARRALANSMLGNFPDVVQDLNGALNHQLPDRVREALEVYCNRLREQISTKSNELKISGDIVNTQGDHQAALDFYIKAYETNPDNIDALVSMANIQASLGLWDAVVVSNTALLETSLSDDDRKATLFRRGHARFELNHAVEAIEDLECAISMNLPTQQIIQAKEYIYQMKELKLAQDRAKFEQPSISSPTLHSHRQQELCSAVACSGGDCDCTNNVTDISNYKNGIEQYINTQLMIHDRGTVSKEEIQLALQQTESDDYSAEAHAQAAIQLLTTQHNILDVVDNENQIKESKRQCTESDRLVKLGMDAYDAKLYEISIDYFTRALESNPENHLAMRNRGNANYKLKNWSSTITDASSYLSLDSNTVDEVSKVNALWRRGNSNKELGNIKEAAADFGHAYSLSLDLQPFDEKRVELLKKMLDDCQTILEADNLVNLGEYCLPCSPDVKDVSSSNGQGVPKDADANEIVAAKQPEQRVTAAAKNKDDAAKQSEEETAAEEGEDSEEEQWDLTKIFSFKELDEPKPTMCDHANDGDVNCGLVACSRWESKGQAPWNSCLDCQVK